MPMEDLSGSYGDKELEEELKEEVNGMETEQKREWGWWDNEIEEQNIHRKE